LGLYRANKTLMLMRVDLTRTKRTWREIKRKTAKIIRASTLSKTEGDRFYLKGAPLTNRRKEIRRPKPRKLL